MSDMNNIAGLEELYNQAVARNQQAKERLKSAELIRRNEQVSHDKTSNALSRQHPFKAHLDDLRLQKHYNRVQTLSHYIEQAAKINHSPNSHPSFDGLTNPLHNITETKNRDLAKVQEQIDSLKKAAEDLISRIELALVKARQQLKREQSLLLRIQQRSSFEDLDGATSLQALGATRNELQSWISSSLASCEQEQTSLTDAAGIEPLSLPKTSDVASGPIEKQYEKYLVARKNLTCAVKELKTPIPTQKMMLGDLLGPAASVARGKQKTQLQQATHIRRSSTSRPANIEVTRSPSLAEICIDHLPTYHHEKLLTSHVVHLAEHTHAQDSRLAQGLNLLNHESHLLPSHPLPVTEPSMRYPATSSQPQSEIHQLLRAWAFASQIADDKLKETMEDYTENAKIALENASRNLEGLTTLSDMKREVIGKP